MSPLHRASHSLLHVVGPVLAALVLLLSAPGWRAELALRAQTCNPVIRDPECATLHFPTASISPRVATTNYNSIILTVEVSDAVGIQQPAGGASVLKKGESYVAISLTWGLKSGRGWNYESPRVLRRLS